MLPLIFQATWLCLNECRSIHVLAIHQLFRKVCYEKPCSDWVIEYLAYSGMQPVAIEEIDRDRSDQFDGTWVLQANDPIGNCQYNYTRAYLTVEDGIGNIGHGEGYVSKTGDFRTEDKVFSNSDWAVRVYGGNLVEARGRVIVDYKWFYATDCTIGFSIKKVK